LLELAGIMIQSILLSYVAIASTATAQLPATGPGPDACKQIASAIGTSKVDSSQLDINYISSTFQYWNARNSVYRPSCVVFPTSAEDVSDALSIIKSSGSRFAIKTVGHNPNKFFSSVDQGVLLDLRKMNQKSYDKATNLITYGPGQSFGDIYNYLQDNGFGVQPVGARLAGVGTGLGLGGGLSYLSTEHGLSVDGFRELEVVLPNATIVTTSASRNPDLFFAMKGGGGNAYGVVTKYVVEGRPVGTVTSGNIIYLFNQTSAIEPALEDFARYNTDPKAAIIGTYEKILTPALGPLQLDEFAILFFVYNGPKSGADKAFANFTRLPFVINTIKEGTYVDAVNIPLPGAAQLARGDNFFRVGAHRLGGNTLHNAIIKWREWAAANKGSYQLTSLDFQPIPASLVEASRRQGGNAVNMPDGPFYYLNYLITTFPGIPQAAYDAIQTSFKQLVEDTGTDPALPLFLNDAAADQNPLQTFSTFSQLQQIKRKYDPDNFFVQKTGGWSFA
jgi:FAD/FMN-containing dehydrogenase